MVLLLGCALTMVSCTKPPDGGPSVAEPTPHPAVESRKMAMTAYPALAIPGSEFNRTFLELYSGCERNDPTALSVSTWPMDLARETAAVIATRNATPTPKPYEPTDLDKGAYGRPRRSVIQ